MRPILVVAVGLAAAFGNGGVASAQVGGSIASAPANGSTGPTFPDTRSVDPRTAVTQSGNPAAPSSSATPGADPARPSDAPGPAPGFNTAR